MNTFDLEERGVLGTSTSPAALEENLCKDELILQGRQRQSIFPFEVLVCIPEQCRRCIPKQFHVFQSWEHVMLFLGVVSCTWLSIDAIQSVYGGFTGKKEVHQWVIRHTVELVFLLPCLYYFFRTLGQYDDDLGQKTREVHNANRELRRKTQATLTAMSGRVDGLAATGVNLSEQHFESNHRTFITFLETWKGRYGSVGITAGSEHTAQLKCFILNWVNAFKECSIDPENSPNEAVKEYELQNLNLDQLCESCINRLDNTQVKFLTIQQQADEALIAEREKNLKDIGFFGDQFNTGFQLVQRRIDSMKGISWIVFGQRELMQHRAENDYLCRLRFGCGSMIILSKEHLKLMIGFCLGWMMLYLETKLMMKALLCVFLFTITLTLILFQEIDIIERLRQEERDIKQEMEDVQKKDQDMEEYWAKARKQTDLWQHRTVPRLSLFAEVCTRLQSMDEQVALDCMTNANKKFDQLHKSLGPLESWFADGALAKTHKQQCEMLMRAAVQEISEARREKQPAEVLKRIMKGLDGLNEDASLKGLLEISYHSDSGAGKPTPQKHNTAGGYI